MKIAIPSNDKINIAGHFGRTKGFVICEIDNQEVIKKEYKENNFTGHAKGKHSEGEHEHHEHHEHHKHEHDEHHSHKGIFDAIGDCRMVIAGGMGRRLYDEFQQKNINVFVTKEKNIDNALNLFFDGNLDNNPNKCCSH